LSSNVGDLATAADLSGLAPISDVRGSSQYRLDAALTLVRRALQEAGNE